MGRWVTIGLLLIFAAPFTAGAATAVPALADIAGYSGPDRMDRLIAGARKEGDVMLYTTLTAPYLDPIIADFKQKYGVTIKYWRGSEATLLQRVLSEARGGRFAWDIVETLAPEVEAIRRNKLLQAVHSPFQKNEIIPNLAPSHREWTADRLYLYVVAYNTNQFKKDDLPKTLEDLLDPRWKGKIGMEAKNWDWFAEIAKEMGEKKGLDFFRKFVSVNGIQVRSGHTKLAGLVAAGEIPIALGLFSHGVDQLRAKDAPIEWAVIGTPIVNMAATGVSRKAPHPYAALLFYEYLLGEDGQKILRKTHLVPAMKGIDSPLSRLVEEHRPVTVIQPSLVLDEYDKWYGLYQSIVVDKSSR
ncbi:MAG TPA: extracellular solute-binding protein [Acidiferrobacterales bacterium]|nr:extracellular solute-binding protein [Acidiferrobacterales bacterium]